MSEPHPPVALVTGAGKRIGRAIAIDLARHGWAVGVHHHCSSDDAAGTLAIIEAEGAHGCIVEADLADETQSAGLMAQSSDALGPVTLLVNNASTYAPGTITETDLELFQSQFDVNFKAPFFLSRDFRNHVPQGHIINLLDTRITSHRKHQYAAYTLAKKALAALTTMAAVEFAPEIRVNGIALGPVIAPPDEADAYLEHAAQRTPLLRPGSPEPVIDTLRFLLSNDHLTGQIIFCDGGENLLG